MWLNGKYTITELYSFIWSQNRTRSLSHKCLFSISQIKFLTVNNYLSKLISCINNEMKWYDITIKLLFIDIYPSNKAKINIWRYIDFKIWHAKKQNNILPHATFN